MTALRAAQAGRFWPGRRAPAGTDSSWRDAARSSGCRPPASTCPSSAPQTPAAAPAGPPHTSSAAGCCAGPVYAKRLRRQHHWSSGFIVNTTDRLASPSTPLIVWLHCQHHWSSGITVNTTDRLALPTTPIVWLHCQHPWLSGFTVNTTDHLASPSTPMIV